MYRSSLFLTAALVGTNIALVQPAVSAKSAGDKTGQNLGIMVERFGTVASAMGVQRVATLSQSQGLNASDYFLRGVSKNNQGDYQGALADYNLAISLNPKFSEAYNNRANLKRDKLNDTQGALVDYSLAISLNPKFSEAYNNRAILKVDNLDNLNDYQGALADFNQAIFLNPKYSKAYYNRAILKDDKLNDVQGALSDYSLAISLNPKDFYAYYNRAILKKDKLNDRAGAIQDYRQAAWLLREPGNTQRYETVIKALKELGATE